MKRDYTTWRDRLIMSSLKRKEFLELNDASKVVGALEFLISTVMRSGAKAFFDPSNEYLWNSVLNGLKAAKATKSYKYYTRVLDNLKSGKNNRYNYRMLQQALIIEEADLISDRLFALFQLEQKTN